ncbi:MAG: class I SAM-dependent methyltransferase [Bacteroidota bacterium]
MDKNYYKEYYHLERNHWWFKARMEILESMIAEKLPPSSTASLKILNVGAATGASSQMLERFGEVTSLEYDKECCQFLAEKVGIQALNASVLELPFADNSFDLICCFDVIEHVEDDDTAVQEMQRVLKEGGHLFITVPAFMFLWSHHDEINHHYRRYTRPQLLSVVNKQGLKVKNTSYFNFFTFFPIALYRLIFSKSDKKKKQSEDSTGSDFEVMNGANWVNTLLYKVFRTEKWILRRNLAFPVGVSIMTLLQKE